MLYCTVLYCIVHIHTTYKIVDQYCLVAVLPVVVGVVVEKENGDNDLLLLTVYLVLKRFVVEEDGHLIHLVLEFDVV